MTSHRVIADLHNHSTASDGEYTPAKLVSKGKQAGLDAISLTDHDTIAGLGEALETGRERGITVIPGVEVSLCFKRPFFVGTLHVLIYFSESLLADSEFKADLNHVVSQGRGLSLVKSRVDAINELFGPESSEPLLKRPLELEELTSQGDNITRRHFFIALSEYHYLKDRKKTDRLIGNTSPAYIPSGIDMSILLPFVTKYPVLKVLAHPAAGSFPGDSHYKEVLPSVDIVERLLPEFLDPGILGIDGLEVYYPAHTKELENKLRGWADHHGLLVTGGSDCHDGKNRPLGTTGIGRGDLDKLISRIK